MVIFHSYVSLPEGMLWIILDYLAGGSRRIKHHQTSQVFPTHPQESRPEKASFVNKTPYLLIVKPQKKPLYS